MARQKNKMILKNNSYSFVSVKLLLIMALSLFSFKSATESPFEELKKLNTKYRELKEYSLDLSYKMFANHTTNKIEQIYTSHYVKKDKTIYMKLDQTTSLQTEKYLIVVSEKDKKIFVSKPTKDVVNQTSLDIIEKTLTQTSTLSVKDEASYRVFNVVFKPGQAQYETMNIYENKKSNCIEKMTLYMAISMKIKPLDPACKEEKPRMEVLFENMKQQVDIETDKLNETYYVTKKGKGFELTSKYKGYKLINNYLQ